MKINQLKIGVIFSYLSQTVSILTGLLYTPIMLRLLGQSEYGLYQLVYSVVSYLGLLSMGFGAGYIRFYSKYKASNDNAQIARLNGMYMIVFSVIAVISVLCGSLLLFKADILFGDGLTAVELEKAKVLLGLMVINIALSFINSVYESNIIAHERFFFNRGINFLHLLLNPVVTLPLLFIGLGSVAVVSVTTVFTIIILVINIFYCIRNLKIKFSFSGFDFGLLKEIWTFTFFIFIIIIVDRINVSVGKFLLGRIVGTVAVAIFGVASQINILYINFSTAISQMFIPRINRLVSEENTDEKISVLFARVGRIQFIVLALIASGFVLFGKAFIKFWAGSNYGGSYWVGVILIISGTIPLIQNLGLEIQKAKNLHKISAFALLGFAVINIILSTILINQYSYIGAALGTAISTVLGNVLFMNVYYHRVVKLDMLHFWKEILKFIPALVFSVVCGVLLKQILPPESSFLTLAIDIVIYSVLYAVFFWLFGMNISERKLIIDPLSSCINRIKEIFSR